MRQLRGIAAVLPAFFLTACASLAPPLQDAASIRAAYTAGDYAAAADLASAALASPGGTDLLTALEAGLALHAAGRWQDSNAAFDIAEERLMWKSRDVTSAADAARLLGGMLLGEDSVPYPGRIYEGVLVNTYKGLNAMMLGDAAAARVEFNRMAARQENAVRQLAAKVAALGDPGPPPDAPPGAAAEIAAAGQALAPEAAARLAAIPRFPGERDLRNPYSYYLAALFRAGTGLNSDLPAARDLLRNAAALSNAGGGGNPYVLRDFAAVESSPAALPPSGRVLVVYEDGLGPVLDAWRIDLALPAPGGGILPLSLALPQFRVRAAVHDGLDARADGQVYPLRPLLDMDALAGTEFHAGYNALLGRAVAAAVLKSLAYHGVDRALEQSGGDPLLADLLRVALLAGQAATTRADIRMAALLPKTVSVAAFPFPSDGVIEILAPDGATVGRLELPAPPASGPVIVRVRIPVAGVPAAMHVSRASAAGPGR